MIDFLTKEEKHQLLVEFNNTEVDYPKDKTIIDLFEEQVKKTPNNIAVVFEETELTYEELNEKSNQLANYLRENYSIKGDDLVGIKLDRSERMITAILGILKSGAAYVPIDVNYPQERIDYIEQDSQCKVVLDETALERFREVQDKCPKENIGKINTPNDLAYVIYTSGTTGNPKGVMVEHTSLINRLEWMQKAYTLSENDVILQKTSYSFDVSVWELFWWIYKGSKLCVLKPEGQRDPEEIIYHIEKYKISVLHFVPSMLTVFLDYLKENKLNNERLKSLKQVFVSGEALSTDQNNKFFAQFSGVSLMNLYGPTEATIDVSYYECTKDEVLIPIGKPIDNIRLFILNNDLQIVPIGVAGKLYISGAGVARGYLNKPELTAEKFVSNPFIEGLRMYDTGDLSRWLPDGNIEFIGRKDHQVKIRGFRIELGEIESVILQYSEDLKQVVLEAKEANEEKVLVAYFTSAKSIDKSELRIFLLGKLPDYMVPGFYIELDELPLTPNGKIDRKALPSVDGGDLIRNEYVAPGDEAEENVVAIWQEILGVERVGVTDNFFGLGGDSIKSIRLLSKINNALGLSYKLSDIYGLPSIKELLSIKLERIDSEISPLIKLEIEESFNNLSKELNSSDDIVSIFPMSDIELGMLYASSTDINIGMYHDQFLYSIPMLNFDQSIVIKALELIVEKHEMLRTAFNVDSYSVPVHLVYRNIEIRLEGEDLSDKDQEDQHKHINEFLIKERTENPFVISKPGLWRMKIFKLGFEQSCLLFQFHHAILDGWSVASLMTELINTYNSILKQDVVTLKKLSLSYKDYVFNQNCIKKDKNQYKYWEDKLSDYKRLDIFTEEIVSNRYNYVVEGELYDSLQEFVLNHGVSMKVLNFSAYLYTLQMLSYDNDVTTGIVTNGRPLSEEGDQILGCFLNSTPFRFGKTNGSILEYVKEVNHFVNIQKQFEGVSLFELSTRFSKDNRGTNPFFDTLFSYVDFHIYSELNLQDTHQVGEFQFNDINFELTNTFLDLLISSTPKGLNISWLLQRTLKGGISVEQIQEYYYNFLDLLIKQPNNVLNKETILSIEEKEDLLYAFNDTEAGYPKDKTIADLFEEQVKKTPYNVAVVFEEIELTYKELNEKSNQLASYLRDSYSIKPDDLVGIKLDRSERMIVAILGVLKSGGAYVPIDVNYPQERIAYIEQDSNSKVVIDEDVLERFTEVQEKYSTENIEKINTPIDLAYVIYTSGTTGNPKGVMIENRSLCNYLKWCSGFYFEKEEEGNFGLFSSLSFDLTVTSLFLPLIRGHKIKVFANNLNAHEVLQDYILNSNALDIIKLTPSHLEILKDLNLKEIPLKKIIVGGEALLSRQVDEILKENNELVIYNEYGPTESTVGCMIKIISKDSQITIGEPISNTQVYILDESLQPLPIGAIGTLYVSGAGLARGYLNKPELTAAKFVSNPFIEGERMYDTGDLGRWLPDGNIEFMGRKDQQVKIRGFRIELGEIENAISQYSEDLKQVLVEAKEANGEKTLVAYFTSTEIIDKSELRSFLLGKLPDYMVPGFYVELDELPLTPNGKIDRKALPGVDGEDLIRNGYVAPGNETEEKLVAIWQEVLGVERVGVTDNFFELGGHSLKITRLISEYHKIFQVKISLKDLFINNTLESHSNFIKISEKNQYIEIGKVEEAESYIISDSQRRLWVLSQFDEESAAFNIPSYIELSGDYDIENFKRAIHSVIERHEILRTVFKVDNSGEIRQWVLPKDKLHFKIDYLDFREKENSEQFVKTYIEEDSYKLFDLEQGPLLRAALIQVLNDKYVFYYNIHHIISDGVSNDVLAKDVFTFYESFKKGEEPNLPDLRIHYKDYAVWQKKQLEEDSFRLHRNYWLTKLGGELPILELPTFNTRPATKTNNGRLLELYLSKEISSKLNDYSHQNGGTLFMGLVASIKAMFYRYTGQEDIIIGTPIAGREHADLKDQIGCYLNTLVLRNQIQGSDSFNDLYSRIKQTALEAYTHQKYPFDRLVEELDLKRDSSRSAIFDVLVVLQNNAEKNKEVILNNDLIESIKDYETKSKFDLSFYFQEMGDVISCTVEYNTDVYDDDLIKRFMLHYRAMLLKVLELPDQPIASVDFLSGEEKEKLLFTFNNIKVNYEETVQ